MIMMGIMIMIIIVIIVIIIILNHIIAINVNNKAVFRKCFGWMSMFILSLAHQSKHTFSFHVYFLLVQAPFTILKVKQDGEGDVFAQLQQPIPMRYKNVQSNSPKPFRFGKRKMSQDIRVVLNLKEEPSTKSPQNPQEPETDHAMWPGSR
jgi:hypothetical protein